ncbi:MAG: SRPBCC domain-containing protein [Thermomicrobiales bacterium]|nr:SRPBCC domain-containing protein [Thermomicrobiales bacterium]
MKMIQQSMLIRDTANNIYAALTSKEDIAQWWGLVNPDADGVTSWYGMDREWAVPIVAMEQDKSIAFAFDAHHPYETERTEPTQITFTIHEQGNHCIVTVLQSMFPDDTWNTLIHDGWVYALLSLQLWVERGIAFRTFADTEQYYSVSKTIALHTNANTAWRYLTRGPRMGIWLGAEVTSDPQVGGVFNIKWSDDERVGGEWVLLSTPRNIVSHWWDAKSLEERDDPGMITVQMWTILPANQGCVVRLSEFGYDRTAITAEGFAEIDAGWDRMLAKLAEITG